MYDCEIMSFCLNNFIFYFDFYYIDWRRVLGAYHSMDMEVSEKYWQLTAIC